MNLTIQYPRESGIERANRPAIGLRPERVALPVHFSGRRKNRY